MHKKILNILIRGASSVSKMILMIFLARWLSPSDFGIYALSTTLNALAILLVGGDLYAVANRDLINARVLAERGIVLLNQFYGMVVIYLVALPLVYFVTIKSGLPKVYLVYFMVVLVFDHISQELIRILLSLKKNIHASTSQFIKQAGWVPFIIFSMYLFDNSRNIESVFLYWMIGCIVSIVISVVVLASLFDVPKSYKFDKLWFGKAISVAVVFLCSTIIYRLLLTLDKMVVEKYLGASNTGIYTFYFSLAMGVSMLTEASVFSFAYQDLVKYGHERNGKNFDNCYSRLFINALAVSIAAGFFVIIITPYLIDLINKSEYKDNIKILIPQVIAAIFFTLSLVPNFGLYAMKKDSAILISNIAPLLLFILSTWITCLTKEISVLSISWVLVFTMLLLFINKLILYKLLKNKYFNSSMQFDPS